MATPEDKQPVEIGGIKKLSQKLYGRAIPKETAERRHKLHENFQEVASGWAVPTQKVSRLRVGSAGKTPSLLYGLFLFSFVFFALSFALAAYFFFSGGNVVSNDRIDILISGPIATPAGEELSLSVEIVNRNSAPLLLSDFSVEYPEGTRSPVDRKTPQPRTLEEVGTIEPGQRVKKTIRGVLFGEENEVKDITIALEYRIEGSNAYLVKEVDYSVTLSSAPIVLLVKAPPEMVSGQDIEIVADVASNATAPIRNVLLKAEYPFGFTPANADPEPTLEDRFWFIGDLMPGDKRTITLRGKLIAQNAEERAFRFQIGSQCQDNDREVCPVFGEITKIVAVQRPFIAANLEVNRSENQPTVITRGKTNTGLITWTNSLGAKILDIEVEVKFSGSAFDRESVKAGTGSYRSIDHTAFWNKNTRPKLASLDPGESEEVEFDFASIPLSANYGLVNPNIGLDVIVRATRLREADEAPETIATEIHRELRVESNAYLAGRSGYSIGPFANTGPFPPRADQVTTYTVTWTVQNSANDGASTYVVGTLPVNVQFVGPTAPSTERVTFNPDTRVVRWDIGNLPYGTGYAHPAREASFQVALLPSVTDVGKELPLATRQVLTVTDRYTGSTIQSGARDVTIRVQNDPEAEGNDFYRVHQ